ncbi:hypothetical protein NSND_63528 [Nitrospira sp. ND1]|nr:hypothetical protein NSND_63528 [Nitrospira sp. ND1]
MALFYSSRRVPHPPVEPLRLGRSGTQFQHHPPTNQSSGAEPRLVCQRASTSTTIGSAITR